jgi:putative aldouronate transport system permease protein
MEAENIKKKKGEGSLSRFKKNFIRDRYLYLMLLPGVILIILFRYLPMGGLVIAFKNFSFRKGIWGSDWVGLDNFLFVFKNPDFYTIVKNTLGINLLKLIFAFPAPIFFALLINEIKSKKLKKRIQISVYLPYFVSWVVFGGIVVQFLNPSSGVVNKIIELFGGQPIAFMQEEKYFKAIVVLSDIWKNAGWGTIMYLSALTSIDQEIYEAAKIDGANRLKMIRHISIPGISATIVVLLLLQIGAMMDVGFEQIYVLCKPILYGVGDVISTYVYRVGIGNAQFSITAAIGLFQSVIGLILIVISNTVCKKLFDKSLW